MSAEVERLKERYEALKSKGVVDLKFVFGPLGEATLDEVCASINEALDAVERGDYVDFPRIGDSRAQ